jgi:hypothetical protein
MPASRLACPLCGRILVRQPSGAVPACPCSTAVAARPLRTLAVQEAGPPEPDGQVPWVRVLLVGGGFAVVLGGLLFLALLVLAINYFANRPSEPVAAAASPTPTKPWSGGQPAPKGGGQKPGGTPAGPGPGQEPLRQAFDALGARNVLDNIKVVQLKTTARFSVAPNVNKLTITWQSTQRFKITEFNGTTKQETGFALKGDQGWAWQGKVTKNMDQPMVADQQLFSYSMSLSNLLPLKEKGYDLVKTGNLRIRDRDCYTIKVRSAGRPEMTLYFDDSTHLLAKSEFRAKMYDYKNFTTAEVYFECYYSDYNATGGVTQWRKFEQYRNGGKYAEMTVDDVRFFDSVDEALFAVPGI